MANIYRIIQIKSNHLLSENVHMIAELPTKRIIAHHNDKRLQSFTYKMAAKINWHKYATKLRHCHPMHSALGCNLRSAGSRSH